MASINSRTETVFQGYFSRGALEMDLKDEAVHKVSGIMVAGILVASITEGKTIFS